MTDFLTDLQPLLRHVPELALGELDRIAHGHYVAELDFRLKRLPPHLLKSAAQRGSGTASPE